MLRRLSRAYDSDDVLIPRVSVDDQQHHNASGLSKGMPSLLPTLDPIEPEEVEWVRPHKFRVLERNIVFIDVQPGFVGVPCEVRQQAILVYLQYCKYILAVLQAVERASHRIPETFAGKIAGPGPVQCARTEAARPPRYRRRARR